jgi:hypothetical protein
MEIADQGHMDTHAVQLLADVGHRPRRFVVVDRDAHQLRAGDGQFLDLNRGANGIGGIGVGHGLQAHRRVTTDRHVVVTPGHHTLARLARASAGQCDRFIRQIVQDPRPVGYRHVHDHFTSKRATLLRA